MGAFVLSFTVIFVVAIGIVAAYGTVLVILYAFVRQSSQRSTAKPTLVPKTRAAHASGD